MEKKNDEQYAFKLSEITAMQLNCIKQLNGIIKEYPDGNIAQMCQAEIAQRKHWAMNPSEVRV